MYTVYNQTAYGAVLAFRAACIFSKLLMVKEPVEYESLSLRHNIAYSITYIVPLRSVPFFQAWPSEQAGPRRWPVAASSAGKHRSPNRRETP
jgi:hypothetical protein